jgi:hypothetical protein
VIQRQVSQLLSIFLLNQSRSSNNALLEVFYFQADGARDGGKEASEGHDAHVTQAKHKLMMR